MSKQSKTIFIAGTDTEVGKTFITQSLIKALQNAGQQVVALKPVASGAEKIDGQWVNEDGSKLYQLSRQTPGFEYLSYQQVNPITFEPAIAPHIAAEEAGVELSCAALDRQLSFPDSELLLVEGAGGWLTPLNDVETYADWVELHRMEVILVVGMKLGCLNHAYLTVRDIERRGLKLSGWVANFAFGEMNRAEQNLDWLHKNIKAPCLGVIPKQQDADFTSASRLLTLQALL